MSTNEWLQLAVITWVVATLMFFALFIVHHIERRPKRRRLPLRHLRRQRR